MPDTPTWEIVAARLEEEASGPSAKQLALAALLDVEIDSTMPRRVAALVLRRHISDEILEPASVTVDDLSQLNQLESELGLAESTALATWTKAELTARIGVLYDLLTARGLRDLQPSPGDVVEGGPPYQRWTRVISSVASSGRVHMRGVPTRMSWPNRLTKISATGTPGHAEEHSRVENEQLNNPMRFSANFQRFRELEEFEVQGSSPSPEAVREFEDLLSTESNEQPFQSLIERHPSLLATTVVGNWKTYVIPQSRLGSQHVTDFLVLGINSAGPQWVLVELEAPRHNLKTQAGRLSGPTRHAIDQINDWRDWLGDNARYAQSSRRDGNGLGLHGITNRAPGLVIIGRADLSSERDTARQISGDQSRIDIHSYDWLLRHAKNMMSDSRMVSEFAWAGVDDRLGRDVAISDLADELFSQDA